MSTPLVPADQQEKDWIIPFGKVISDWINCRSWSKNKAPINPININLINNLPMNLKIYNDNNFF
jgi:hypothetical protein